MALRIDRKLTRRKQLLLTAFSVFAFMIAPFYGIVADRVASAATTPDIFVNQATGNNDATDNIYTTINEALDEASAGDVISVAAGVYVESLEITKQVRLEGDGAARTTITNDPSVSTYLIRLNANAQSGTKISGFTLENTAPDKPVLKLGTDANLNNLYITGNHFKSNNKHLIYGGNVSDSNFTSNTFYVDGINNIGMKRGAVYFEGTSSGNTFKNNKFVGDMESMTLGITGDNNTFLANDLSGLATAYNKVFEVSGNNNTDTGNVYGDNQVVINPNSSNFRGVYRTIADAIDVAHSGDTLFVGGNISEGLVGINKDITITGDSDNRPVVSPTADTANNAGWFTVEPGIELSMSSVVLDGSGKKIHTAILSSGATTTVEYVDIKNINFNPTSGFGIASYGGVVGGGGGKGTHQAANLTVTNSNFSNIQRVGVLVKGDDSEAIFNHNTYTGKGDGVHIDYAVDVNAGAQLTAVGNTVTGNTGIYNEGAKSAAFIVGTFHGSGTKATFENNQILNNFIGIGIGYDENDTASVEAKHNNITGNNQGVANTSELNNATVTSNWWGDKSGPGGEAAGDGDSVDVNVEYSPWLCQPYGGEANPKVSDENGNCDTTAPEFAIESPADGSIVRGTVDVEARVTDDSGIQKLLMTVPTKTGNKTFVYEEGKSNNSLTKNDDVYSVSIDTNTLNDGVVHVVLRGTDGAGNQRYWNNNANNRQHSFTVDNTAPNITEATLNGKTAKIAERLQNCGPTDFNLVRGKIGVSAVITDLEGVTNANYRVLRVNSGGCVMSNPSTNYGGVDGYGSTTVQMSNTDGDTWTGAEFDTNTVPEDGNYTIRITAKDVAGNTTVRYVDITVDNTAPVAKIASHNDGDEVSGLVTLVGEVEDNNPMNTHFAISGPNGYSKSETKRDGHTQHSLDWDVSALPNGEYTVQFEARDQAQNKTNASVKRIKLNVNNPQPVVNGENFNTHSGSDYNGLNVGFNIADFNEVTGVTVELYDGETLMVANTHNQALLDLIASGQNQHGTPFITVPGTYTEEYWNLGSYDWTSDSPRPTKAVVTVIGTNNLGQSDSYTATLENFSEPNSWTFASILPKKEPKTPQNRPAGGAPRNPGLQTFANIISSAGEGNQIFQRGNFATGLPTGNEPGEQEEGGTEGNDPTILGEQDESGSLLDDTAILGAQDEGGVLGLSWQWWLAIVAGLIGGWLLIAAGIRRMRGAES